MTARTNKIFLIFELAVLAIFLVVGIIAINKGVNGAHFSFDPIFQRHNFSLSVVFAAVSIAVLSFLGFDAISTLSEESKGGPKAVGRGMVYSLLLVGVLFIVQTWVAALIDPNYKGFTDLDRAFYETADIAGGSWLGALTAVATALSWGIADALVAQAAISRVLYSMGRDRRLPHFLAKVHPKHQTPYLSIFLVAGLSIILGLIFLNHVGYLSSLVNFGAISAFILLHVSVFVYFIVKQHSHDILNYLILPAIGFIIIGFVWLNFSANARMLGLIWLGIGIVVAIVSAIRGRNKTDVSSEGS